MANCASVDYVIEDSIDNLKMIKNAIDSGKGEVGEVEILIELGLSEDCLEKYSLRGCVIDNSIENDTLKVYAEEAWCLSDFSEAIQEIFPHSNIYWYVEEPGMEIYETNDSEGKYFPAKYVLEYYVNWDLEGNYYPESEEDLFEITSVLTDGKVTDFQSLDKFNENESTYFILHNIRVI